MDFSSLAGKSFLAAVVFAGASATNLMAAETNAVAPRPAAWASPLPGQPGLPNLNKVSDDLYRGAQPEKEGFATLKKMGVKTVVNLRTHHSDRKDCQAAELDYVHITAQAREAEDQEVVDFLKVVSDPARQPVFVHCWHGADRTGLMSAVYRVVVQGWDKEEAIREMTQGGYRFHKVYQNLVEYIRNLDVEAIKKAAATRPSPSP